MQIRETSSLLTVFKTPVAELMKKKLDICFDLKKSINRKETENLAA